MIGAAQSDRIEEAREWLDEVIQGVRDRLGKEGGQVGVRVDINTAVFLYDSGVLDPATLNTWIHWMVDCARQNAMMTRATCHLAAHLIEQGQRLPDPLRRYVLEVLRGQGAGPHGYEGRDGQIVLMLNWLHERFDIPRFKNRERRFGSDSRLCGADLVEERLRAFGIPITYRAIEAAWARFNRTTISKRKKRTTRKEPTK
jgi:hypothetical protein